MQAPISTVAHWLERMVSTLPMSGSMAALARWNSRMQQPNTSRARLLSRLRRSTGGLLVRSSGRLPCARSGSISAAATPRSTSSVGTSNAAVTKNTAWGVKK